MATCRALQPGCSRISADKGWSVHDTESPSGGTQPTKVNFHFHEPEALADFLQVERTRLAPQAHCCRLCRWETLQRAGHFNPDARASRLTKDGRRDRVLAQVRKHSGLNRSEGPMQRFRGTLTEKFSVGTREPTQFPKA